MARKKQRELPFVEIHWKDAASDSSWRDRSRKLKLAEVIHRGWIVAEDGESVTLAAGIVLGHSGVTDCGDCISIPRGCIISIREIEA
jgi:hypothetical protein